MKTRTPLRDRWTTPFAWAGLAFSCWSGPADLTLQTADKEPPAELAAPFREILQNRAVQLLDGDRLVYEFWFRTEIALKENPETAQKALAAIPETTVLGAVSIHQDRRDYRDDEIYSGVYTIRFGFRPDDGNHLGTSDFRFFAVLIPAKLDGSLDGITSYKQMVKASSRETASDHPVILSLRPAGPAEGESPRLNEPAAGHKSVLLKLCAKVAGRADPAAVFFDLVYEGAAKH